MIRHWLVGLGLATAVARPSQAQLASNPPYDGRVALARLKYATLDEPGGCQTRDSPAGPGWGHDYPMSVQGLMTALTELTSVQAVKDSTVVFTADDPELLKYPIVMLTEPGCWDPTEAEAKGLRTYLLKGGFLIVDDLTFFDCSPEHDELAIERFEAWMQRVLPGARPLPLTPPHPVFDNFLPVDPASLHAWCAEPVQPVGIYRDNDPAKRLLVVSNYHGAVGHMWRFVGTDLGSGLEEGGMPYRLGLNYFLYGMSH